MSGVAFGVDLGLQPHPALPGVLSWLEERKDEMARFLEMLVRAESPTTRPELQEEVFRLLGEAFEGAGHSVRRYAGTMTGGQLLSRPRLRVKGRPYQLILGHVDTVWPSGTLERMPIERNNGRMTGPGIFDMKGGLAQLAFALRALGELEIEPEVTPVVFLNSDEEIGSVESEHRIRRLARKACRALVLEPGLDLDGKLKTARRGVGRFDVRVTGRSSHTGLAPQEGASAIQELSHVIQKLHAISDARRGITVNVGQIKGGTRPNVVAAEATAVVD
ncbi:MAG: M20/M25/M40 family metallo-hydrolase, partial [Gemmatimonadota bacterium]